MKKKEKKTKENRKLRNEKKFKMKEKEKKSVSSKIRKVYIEMQFFDHNLNNPLK